MQQQPTLGGSPYGYNNASRNTTADNENSDAQMLKRAGVIDSIMQIPKQAKPVMLIIVFLTIAIIFFIATFLVNEYMVVNDNEEKEVNKKVRITLTLTMLNLTFTVLGLVVAIYSYLKQTEVIKPITHYIQKLEQSIVNKK